MQYPKHTCHMTMPHHLVQRYNIRESVEGGSRVHWCTIKTSCRHQSGTYHIGEGAWVGCFPDAPCSMVGAAAHHHPNLYPAFIGPYAALPYRCCYCVTATGTDLACTK
jgi:hypothetical protein